MTDRVQAGCPMLRSGGTQGLNARVSARRPAGAIHRGGPVAYLCWCGVELTPDDLEDMEAELPDTCGGNGSLRCMCGGDFCCCHNHGTVDCDGCVDCRDDDDDWYEGEPDHG